MSNSTIVKAIGCLWIAARLALPVLADDTKLPGLPKPITTAQRLFAIPFYLNPNSRVPQRVVLFVSGDKGQSWTLYQRRTSEHRKFDFHAGEDGEYWFVVRATQQTPPNAVTVPEKIVIVDQHKPELDMAIELSPEGLLKARWTVNDPTLDAKTFRLEYRQTGEQQWRPVTVSMPPAEANTSFVGDVSWVPSQVEGDLVVRAEVLDGAGNSAKFEEKVRIYPTATAQRPIERRVADRNTDVEPTVSARAAPRSAPTTSPPDQTYPRPESQDAVPARADSSGVAAADAPSDLGWRTTAPDRSPLPQSLAAEKRLAPPETGYDLFDPLVHPLDSVSRSPVGGAPVRGEYLPPVASQAAPETAPSQLSRPVSRQIRMTNSRRFNLDYDVADAGDSGVARVELWITHDDGRTWKAYGTDTDVASPFTVELNREGTYGFRLLIHNGLGASAGPPQPGDPADLWVGVDLTPPQARLNSARLGTGTRAGILDIGWVATDVNLTETPIRLSYAERLEGPWMPVAEPLPNTGFYRWRIPEKVSDWVYLKIDVADRAGNETSAQLPKPVSTIPVPPSGRIRAISPVGGLPSAR